jgi:hypothetical protein
MKRERRRTCRLKKAMMMNGTPPLQLPVRWAADCGAAAKADSPVARRCAPYALLGNLDMCTKYIKDMPIVFLMAQGRSCLFRVEYFLAAVH